MTERLNPFQANGAAMQAWMTFSTSFTQSTVEPAIFELVKIRASQINGCARCMAMHTQAARQAGETEERIFLLDAWRETNLYSPRERAALAWTEALTLVADRRASDADYGPVKAQFTDKEQVDLTLMIVTINGWNRLQIGFGASHIAPIQAAA